MSKRNDYEVCNNLYFSLFSVYLAFPPMNFFSSFPLLLIKFVPITIDIKVKNGSQDSFDIYWEEHKQLENVKLSLYC